ncbi:hypothetical protein Emtol_2209 [Emticicia oligotrophica DSM 17448]|uniref:Uncharacterized protein n=1 Tax=Emticicia oligotrophica (strain DSM 17448 / CIP 109782 / MTCC 6937 / GPTSA100-15) TaxID=929562 RepID=A0ABM5N1X9_EMTOG|nr:hypothetical protein Emtol_2209 [Emticicia oligotrophica DSM 17448]
MYEFGRDYEVEIEKKNIFQIIKTLYIPFTI